MTIAQIRKVFSPMNQWIYKTFITGMIGIIGFFLVATYARLTGIETEVMQLRINLARLQIPSPDEIREICRYEIYKNDREKNDREKNDRDKNDRDKPIIR